MRPATLFAATAGTVLALTLLHGCATRVNHPVPDERRDTSGAHDGHWRVQRLASPRRQIIAGEYFSCSIKAFDFDAFVRDGVLSVLWAGATHTANVDVDGRFRVEIPTEDSYRRSRGANANASDITLVLQGSLAGEDPSGLFTIGAARLNDQGCEARARFERI